MPDVEEAENGLFEWQAGNSTQDEKQARSKQLIAQMQHNYRKLVRELSAEEEMHNFQNDGARSFAEEQRLYRQQMLRKQSQTLKKLYKCRPFKIGKESQRNQMASSRGIYSTQTV